MIFNKIKLLLVKEQYLLTAQTYHTYHTMCGYLIQVGNIHNHAFVLVREICQAAKLKSPQ